MFRNPIKFLESVSCAGLYSPIYLFITIKDVIAAEFGCSAADDEAVATPLSHCAAATAAFPTRKPSVFASSARLFAEHCLELGALSPKKGPFCS